MQCPLDQRQPFVSLSCFGRSSYPSLTLLIGAACSPKTQVALRVKQRSQVVLSSGTHLSFLFLHSLLEIILETYLLITVTQQFPTHHATAVYFALFGLRGVRSGSASAGVLDLRFPCPRCFRKDSAMVD